MEEMSWGQMIFNWQTPAEISLINAQGETNFHNIGFIDAHSDFAFGMILAVVISISFLGDKFSRFAGKKFCGQSHSANSSIQNAFNIFHSRMYFQLLPILRFTRIC